MSRANAPVVVITGASSGIGRSTALHFAAQNFRLSLTGRNEAALEELVLECLKNEDLAKSDICITIGDLRELNVAESLLKNTIDTFGRIDSLVNNAGMYIIGTTSQLPMSDYDRQMNVNTRSVVQLTKLIIPYLISTKGTIVNVSSIAGTCAFPAATYYCMSKAVIVQFTKFLALELAPEGVRVNSVNPGVIDNGIHKRAGMSDKEYNEFLLDSKKALGRVGYGPEVAEVIHFLATKQSSFTTGELIHVDGGRHLMIPA